MPNERPRWSLLFFPREGGIAAKNGQFDIIKFIGLTHPERQWVGKLCTTALRLPRSSGRLLEWAPARYLQLWYMGRKLANME